MAGLMSFYNVRVAGRAWALRFLLAGAVMAAVIASLPDARAQGEEPTGTPTLRVGTKKLLVCSYECNADFPSFCNALAAPNSVLAYQPTGTAPSTVHINGNVVGPSGMTFLDGPFGIVLHPLHGTLLIASRKGKRIDEFNARTGAWIRTFAARNIENDMNSPQYMIFKRNSDHVLVGVHPNADHIDAIDGILEFDGEGNYVGVFVPNDACIFGPNGVPGGNDDNPYDSPLESAAMMSWGLAGTAVADHLFVASENSHRIIEYDANGCYAFVMGSPYLAKPEGLIVRPAGSVDFHNPPISNAGNILVTTLYPDPDALSQQQGIIEFNPITHAQVFGQQGAFGYAFALGVGFPGSMLWDPDNRLLIGDRFWYYQASSQYSDRIRRLNQTNGVHISYIAPTSGMTVDRKLRASEGMLIISYGFATGNYDGDGDVDYQDYQQFQMCFGDFTPTAQCLTAFDDNLSGVIDLSDYDAFVGYCSNANNCTSVNTCAGQANGTACNDGSMCTSGDTCQSQVCAPGPALSCNDGNACTDDSCHPLNGCSNAPNAGSCNDGDACTVGDACVNSACASGNPRECNDGDGCTDDSCIPASGCEFVPNENPCDDANACTEDDTCSNGTCAGTFFSCDDGNPCTTDGCQAVGGCTHQAIPCGGACCNGVTCTQVAGPAECSFVCNVADHLPATFAGCYGDANGDGFVNAGDRGFVAANIGESDPVLLCLYDMDGNGFINAGDRGFIAVNIGLCTALPDYMDGSGLNDGQPETRFPGGVFFGEGSSCQTVTCP